MNPSASRAFPAAILSAALLLVAFPNQALAQDNAYKIGVVNVKEVFDNYERQKHEYELLQNEKDKKQAEIDILSKRITKQKDRYDNEKITLSDEEREDLEEQIESDYSLYKSEFKRLQEDIDRREKKLLEAVFEDIHTALQEVGLRDDYHLILEGGKSGRAAVLYYSTTMNMTQKVIDHLNTKYSDS